MQYLFSQQKCKRWREKMKIFREQTDPTQLNAPRNACLTGEGWSRGLRCRRDGMCHIYLPPQVPLQPITEHTIRGSPGLREADKNLVEFLLQFKGFAGRSGDNSQVISVSCLLSVGITFSSARSMSLSFFPILLTEKRPTVTTLMEPWVSPPRSPSIPNEANEKSPNDPILIKDAKTGRSEGTPVCSARTLSKPAWV